MGRGKMQRCVVAHVRCVNSCPATDLLIWDVDNHHEDGDDVYEDDDNDDDHIAYQHLHDLGVSPLGRPVQWRELMIIPVINWDHNRD